MLWIVGSIIILLLLLTLVMSFPSVQTYAAKKGVGYLNEQYQTDIKVDRARYVFPDQVILSEVFIRDEEKDTLIYARIIDANLRAFAGNQLYSAGVKLIRPRFYHLKKKGKEVSNLKEFISKFSRPDTVPKSPFGLEISYIDIESGRFSFDDLNCDSCFSLQLRNLNAHITNFDLYGAYFTADIQSLSVKQQDAFTIEEFSANFAYLEDRMEVENFAFKTTASRAKGNLVMHYDSTDALQNFVNEVSMDALVEEGDIASSEVQFFSPSFPDFGQFQFRGSGQGLVNDLKTENVDLYLAEGTHFTGERLDIRNSTRPADIYFDGEKLELQTLPGDIRSVYSLFSDSSLPWQVEPLGDVQISGDFKGYTNDFRTDLIFSSALGNAFADLQLKLPEDAGAISYSGQVALKSFDLGRLLNQPDLGKVSTSMQVRGQGIDPVEMQTRLKGKISALDYNSYSYSAISVDGNIRKGRFVGELKIEDPNLQFDFNGSASFGEDTSFYEFKAEIARADLHALNFSKDSIAGLTANMDIKLRALNFDRWAGDVRLFNLTYENSSNFHFFQDITVHSQGLEGERLMQVRSNILNADLTGEYSLNGIVEAVRAHISKYVKTQKVSPPPKDQDFEFDVDINNAKVITDLFFPDFKVDPGTEFSGNYSSATNNFKINLSSPSFDYNKNKVRGLDLAYEGADERSQLEFEVGRFVAPKGLTFDSIVLSNYYYQDTLNYDLRWILRDSVDSRGNLMGYAIQRDSVTFELGLNTSGFNYGYEDFNIQGDNRILVDTGGIRIENFVLTNQGRSLRINGNISNNPNEILRVNIRGLGMDVVNYLIGSDEARFEGDINGDVIITEILGTPKFAAEINIDSLNMNQTALGRLNIGSDWSVEEDTIHIETSLRLGELTTFRGNGYYQPDSLGSIDFKLDFERFRLAAFNPMLEGLAENLRGYLSGSVNVSGNTGSPVVTGEVGLPKTAFTVSFLQTDYNLVGTPTVKFREDGIYFPALTLRDTRYGTEGILSGKINHDHFHDFNVDLKVDANELLVLNTNYLTEDPYYGTAFVSGNIFMRGPFDDLLISGNLSSRRNSEFYIQMGRATEVNQSDFITFVNRQKEDSLAVREVRNLNLNKGVSLDFNLDINQNATVGIIIDRETGNRIQGTGFGNIRVKIDQFSDVEIYGNYTVADGYYNFVLEEPIRRRFDILRGGKLTWNGDPYDAVIDLTARYRTKADPSVLVPQYTGGRTVVYVDLRLSEELMNPNINFDVSAPRATSNVQSVLSSRLTDQNTRYEQVFSLITMGRFTGDEGVAQAAGNTWSSGLGLKVLASQAESYLNQFTGDLSVTLDYEGSNNDPAGLNPTQEEVEVGGSIDILNDRITVNGVVGVPVGANNNQSQLTGDFEVEYDITEDGRFRARVFNRPIQQYSFGQQFYQQGVGVYYRIDFNHVFPWNRKATREEDEEEDEKTEEPSGDPQNPENEDEPEEILKEE